LSTLLAPAAIGALALFTYSRYAHPDWTPREHGTLREAYEAFLARVRNETPLPPMTGTTDAYPWNKALVLACGLPLRSRPVIQSYCAFSPELAELNAAFLRGGHGAENIVFQLNTVDDRYPSLDDGRSWPELLTQYDLRDAEDSFLLLTRSSSPREFHLTPIRELSLAFRERLDLPATNDGPIWAEIEIPRTLRGSIMAALYKPPELWFHIKLRDGRVMVKRLIPGKTTHRSRRSRRALGRVILPRPKWRLLASPPPTDQRRALITGTRFRCASTISTIRDRMETESPVISVWRTSGERCMVPRLCAVTHPAWRMPPMRGHASSFPATRRRCFTFRPARDA
jgi:hypothetical protein